MAFENAIITKEDDENLNKPKFYRYDLLNKNFIDKQSFSIVRNMAYNYYIILNIQIV